MNISVGQIQGKIFFIRGQQVILDKDLARIYQIRTDAVNQAVKRNKKRFPPDFWFQLTAKEKEVITLNVELPNEKNHGGRRSLPYAFSQGGITMLSGILNNDRAVQANIKIIRAFLTFRAKTEETFNFDEKLNQLDNKLQAKIDEHFQTFFSLLKKLEQRTSHLVNPSSLFPNEAEKLLIEGPISEKVHLSILDKITNLVTSYFSVNVNFLKGPARVRSITFPRQIAIFLIRKHTKMSLVEIGLIFGGKDHSTILHSCRKIEKALGEDHELGKIIHSFETQLAS